MNRREFVKGVLGASSAGALSGCLGGLEGDEVVAGDLSVENQYHLPHNVTLDVLEGPGAETDERPGTTVYVEPDEKKTYGEYLDREGRYMIEVYVDGDSVGEPADFILEDTLLYVEIGEVADVSAGAQSV